MKILTVNTKLQNSSLFYKFTLFWLLLTSMSVFLQAQSTEFEGTNVLPINSVLSLNPDSSLLVTGENSFGISLQLNETPNVEVDADGIDLSTPNANLVIDAIGTFEQTSSDLGFIQLTNIAEDEVQLEANMETSNLQVTVIGEQEHSFSVTSGIIGNIQQWQPIIAMGLTKISSGKNGYRISFDEAVTFTTTNGNSYAVYELIIAAANTLEVESYTEFNLTVEDSDGAFEVLDIYTDDILPVVKTLSTNKGHYGERITISGEEMNEVYRVAIGETLASFEVIDDNTIVASIPEGAIGGHIVLNETVKSESTFEVAKHHGCPPPLCESAMYNEKDGKHGLYIKWNGGESVEAYELRYRISTEAEWRNASTIDKHYMLAGLQENMNYEIQAKAICSKEDDLSSEYSNSIFAKTSFEEKIQISKPLFEEVSQWMQEKEQGTSISDYLNQQDFLDSQEVDIFLKSFFSGRGGDEGCHCKTLAANVTTGLSPSTTTTLTNNDNLNSGYAYTKRNDEKTRYAAAHNLDLHLRGKRRHAAWTTQDFNSNNATSFPYFAEYHLNFMCLGDDDLPDNCDCSKSIDLDVNYDAKLRAIGELGKRNAFVKASTEEVATLLTYDVVSPSTTIDILAVEYEGVKVELEQYLNAAAFVNWINLGAAIANAVIQGNVTTADVGIFQDIFSSLITIPLTIGDGIQASEGRETTLSLAYNGFIQLQPNTHKVVALYSATKQYAEGKAKGSKLWRAKSYSDSNFNASMVILRDSDEPGCCTRKTGTWMYGSLGDPAPKNIATLQNNVGAHLGVSSKYIENQEIFFLLKISRNTLAFH